MEIARFYDLALPKQPAHCRRAVGMRTGRASGRSTSVTRQGESMRSAAGSCLLEGSAPLHFTLGLTPT